MDYLKLPGGESYRNEGKAIIIALNGPRRVLSTSAFNGGCRDDLAFLFNFCEVYGKEDEHCEMRAATYEEHLRLLAEELALDPKRTTGLSTAARMKYARLNTEEYDDFTVTAIVTGGIDDNGSRPGDPAFWHEKGGVPCPLKPGTINIIVFIDACLPGGALARALGTITEAKAAALQEVLAPSCYSSGLATGSGTDGVIVVSNLESPTSLTDAGQHSKLGEVAGRVVKRTVREAVSAENGFEAYACSSMFRRIGRFGVNEESLWELYCSLGRPGFLERDVFRRRLDALDREKELIALAPVYAHLLDLLEWKLIGWEQAERLAEDLLAGRRPAGAADAGNNLDPAGTGGEAGVKALVNRFSRHLISLVAGK